MLDVGGGRGVLRHQLEASTSWTIDIAEINNHALRQCTAGRGELLYYDIEERNEALLGVYDGVLLFDVIEHLPDPGAFAAVAGEHLKSGGWLFVNVPAINALRSAYDDALGHLRRYGPHSLRDDLSSAGLDVIGVHYWGLSMVPLLALRTMMLGPQLGDRDAGAIISRGWRPPESFAGAVLKALMSTETAVLPTPFYGTSLMAICRKRV